MMKKENNKGVTLFKKEYQSRFPEKKILTKPEMKTAKIKNTLLGRVKARATPHITKKIPATKLFFKSMPF